MNNNFEIGDTVCLKSGGPKMSIMFLQEYTEEYTCQWFDSKHALQQGSFPGAALVKVEENPDSGPSYSQGSFV